jgi:hypothetical protein
MDSGLPVINRTRDAPLTLGAYTCEDLGEKEDFRLSRYIPALGLVSPTRTILYVPTLGVACRPTLAAPTLHSPRPRGIQ